MNAKIVRDCFGFDGTASISLSAGTPCEFSDWVAAKHPNYPKGTELVEIEIGGSRMAAPAFAVEMP